MKKIGLILLYFFVPVLLFRIFLDRDFGTEEIKFAIVASVVIIFMYILAYVFSIYKVKKLNLKDAAKQDFIKTVLTNQGRSAAFIGGALLASPWFVEAAIFIALVGVALFAVIPWILSYMHKEETKESDENIHALPWYLKLYPWYLITFAIVAIALHSTTGIKMADFGDIGTIVTFYSAITIPAALYYVGAGIHPYDLKISEMKKLFSLNHNQKGKDHWPWVRSIFLLTVIITPLIISAIFGLLYVLGLITSAWLAVIVINSILPITSTNMFLVPYGINKKVTALSITWTTIVCVPIIVFLITFFSTYL
jgi:predicted permease